MQPTMTKPKKFIFDLNFDDPRIGDSADSIRDEHQIKLDQMLAEAFASGHKAGIDEALQSIESQTLEALNKALLQTQKIAQVSAPFEQAANAKASAAALLALQQLFPHVQAAFGLAEIETVMTQTLRRAVELPRLTVFVGPDTLQALESKLAQLAEQTGFSGKLQMFADPALGSMDCRIDWGNGGLEHIPSQLWQELAQLWRENLPASLRPPETIIDPNESPKE